jgi:ATP-dependent protease Clp ATPase subunit
VIQCSYCGRGESDVAVLVAGKKAGALTAYICEDCVQVCVSIIAERVTEQARELRRRNGGTPPWVFEPATDEELEFRE